MTTPTVPDRLLGKDISGFKEALAPGFTPTPKLPTVPEPHREPVPVEKPKKIDQLQHLKEEPRIGETQSAAEFRHAGETALGEFSKGFRQGGIDIIVDIDANTRLIQDGMIEAELRAFDFRNEEIRKHADRLKVIRHAVENPAFALFSDARKTEEAALKATEPANNLEDDPTWLAITERNLEVVDRRESLDFMLSYYHRVIAGWASAEFQTFEQSLISIGPEFDASQLSTGDKTIMEGWFDEVSNNVRQQGQTEVEIEEIADALLRRPRPKVTLLDDMTEQEIIKALSTTPKATLPNGISKVDVINMLKDQALKADDFGADFDKAKEIWADLGEQYASQRTATAVLKAQLIDPKLPDLSNWDAVKLAALQPALVLAEAINPYFVHVSQPWTTFALKTTLNIPATTATFAGIGYGAAGRPGAIVLGGIGLVTSIAQQLAYGHEIRTIIDSIHASGESGWQVYNLAYEEWDTPLGWKIITESTMDPANLVGMNIVGRATVSATGGVNPKFARLLGKVPIFGKPVTKVGYSMGKFEQGFIEMMDQGFKFILPQQAGILPIVAGGGAGALILAKSGNAFFGIGAGLVTARLAAKVMTKIPLTLNQVATRFGLDNAAALWRGANLRELARNPGQNLYKTSVSRDALIETYDASVKAYIDNPSASHTKVEESIGQGAWEMGREPISNEDIIALADELELNIAVVPDKAGSLDPIVFRTNYGDGNINIVITPTKRQNFHIAIEMSARNGKTGFEEAVNKITLDLLGDGKVASPNKVREWLTNYHKKVFAVGRTALESKESPRDAFFAYSNAGVENRARHLRDPIFDKFYQDGRIVGLQRFVDTFSSLSGANWIERNLVYPFSRHVLYFLNYGSFNVLENGIRGFLAGVPDGIKPLRKAGRVDIGDDVRYHLSDLENVPDSIKNYGIDGNLGVDPIQAVGGDLAQTLAGRPIIDDGWIPGVSMTIGRAASFLPVVGGRTESFINKYIPKYIQSLQQMNQVASRVGGAQQAHIYLETYFDELQKRAPQYVIEMQAAVGDVSVAVGGYGLTESHLNTLNREIYRAILGPRPTERLQNLHMSLAVLENNALRNNLDKTFAQFTEISQPMRDRVINDALNGTLNLRNIDEKFAVYHAAHLEFNAMHKMEIQRTMMKDAFGQLNTTVPNDSLEFANMLGHIDRLIDGVMGTTGLLDNSRATATRRGKELNAQGRRALHAENLRIDSDFTRELTINVRKQIEDLQAQLNSMPISTSKYADVEILNGPGGQANFLPDQEQKFRDVAFSDEYPLAFKNQIRRVEAIDKLGDVTFDPYGGVLSIPYDVTPGTAGNPIPVNQQEVLGVIYRSLIQQEADRGNTDFFRNFLNMAEEEWKEAFEAGLVPQIAGQQPDFYGFNPQTLIDWSGHLARTGEASNDMRKFMTQLAEDTGVFVFDDMASNATVKRANWLRDQFPSDYQVQHKIDLTQFTLGTGNQQIDTAVASEVLQAMPDALREVLVDISWNVQPTGTFGTNIHLAYESQAKSTTTKKWNIGLFRNEARLPKANQHIWYKSLAEVQFADGEAGVIQSVFDAVSAYANNSGTDISDYLGPQAVDAFLKMSSGQTDIRNHLLSEFDSVFSIIDDAMGPRDSRHAFDEAIGQAIRQDWPTAPAAKQIPDSLKDLYNKRMELELMGLQEYNRPILSPRQVQSEAHIIVFENNNHHLYQEYYGLGGKLDSAWSQFQTRMAEIRAQKLLLDDQITQALGFSVTPRRINAPRTGKLTYVDVAQMYDGTEITNLTSNMVNSDAMTMVTREQFVLEHHSVAEMLAKKQGQTADELGFTMTNLEELYDSLMRGLNFDPTDATFDSPARVAFAGMKQQTESALQIRKLKFKMPEGLQTTARHEADHPTRFAFEGEDALHLFHGTSADFEGIPKAGNDGRIYLSGDKSVSEGFGDTVKNYQLREDAKQYHRFGVVSGDEVDRMIGYARLEMQRLNVHPEEIDSWLSRIVELRDTSGAADAGDIYNTFMGIDRNVQRLNPTFDPVNPGPGRERADVTNKAIGTEYDFIAPDSDDFNEYIIINRDIIEETLDPNAVLESGFIQYKPVRNIFQDVDGVVRPNVGGGVGASGYTFVENTDHIPGLGAGINKTDTLMYGDQRVVLETKRTLDFTKPLSDEDRIDLIKIVSQVIREDGDSVVGQWFPGGSGISTPETTSSLFEGIIQTEDPLDVYDWLFQNLNTNLMLNKTFQDPLVKATDLVHGVIIDKFGDKNAESVAKFFSAAGFDSIRTPASRNQWMIDGIKGHNTLTVFNPNQIHIIDDAAGALNKHMSGVSDKADQIFAKHHFPVVRNLVDAQATADDMLVQMGIESIYPKGVRVVESTNEAGQSGITTAYSFWNKRRTGTDVFQGAFRNRHTDELVQIDSGDIGVMSDRDDMYGQVLHEMAHGLMTDVWEDLVPRLQEAFPNQEWDNVFAQQVHEEVVVQAYVEVAMGMVESPGSMQGTMLRETANQFGPGFGEAMQVWVRDNLRDRMPRVPIGWQETREQSATAATDKLNQILPDYTSSNMLDATMRRIYPYWTYETQRYPWLIKHAVKNPGATAAWGRYIENSDAGYTPIPGTGLDVNPLRGTVWMGGLRRLYNRDYQEYADAYQTPVEWLDAGSRAGFFPNIAITLPITFFGQKDRLRQPQRGEVLPPYAQTLLGAMTLVGGDAQWVKTLNNIIFPDRFRDYRIQNTVIGMGHDGVKMLNDQQQGLTLNEEDQAVWDKAGRKVALVAGTLDAQVGIFRMREEEKTEAYEALQQGVYELIGVPPEVQEAYNNKFDITGTRWSDVYPLDPMEQYVLRELLEKYKNWLRPSTGVLLPSELGRVRVKITSYYDELDAIWEKARSQGFTSTNTLTGEVSLSHKSLEALEEEWSTGKISSTEYLNGVQRTIQRATVAASQLADTDYYRDVPKTRDEREAFWVASGNPIPTFSAGQELLWEYFALRPKLAMDEFGVERPDFDRYFLELETLLGSIPPAERQRLLDRIQIEWTDSQRLHWQVNREVMRPYLFVDDVVFDRFSEEDQAIISEFRQATVGGKARLREEESEGSGVVARFESEKSIFRQNLRELDPELDAWLLFWNETSTVRTNQARVLYNQMLDKYRPGAERLESS